MTTKISPITYNGTSKTDELDDSIVLFDEPLQMVGTNERQWNGTVYDLASTDVSKWDGIITQDHGSKLTDVIGKAIGLFKNKQGIYIRGIKYATDITPTAILAKNLLVSGFAPGFSCETLGPDPDENGIWHNHVVCGLSQVVHPNDKMAYAVVTNSLEEADKAGFDTTELKKEMNSIFDPWKDEFKRVENDIKSEENGPETIDITDEIMESDAEIDLYEEKDNSIIYDELGRVSSLEEITSKNGVEIVYDTLGRRIDNGGEGSGWFNPEHAAHMVSERSKIAPTLNGEGKKLVKGIQNNRYIDDAISATGINTSNSSPMTSRLHKRIVKENLLAEPGYCTLKKKTTKGLSDISNTDRAAVNTIDRIVQLHTNISSNLTEYAAAKDDRYIVSASKKNIRQELEKAKALISKTKTLKMGLEDSKGNFTPIDKALGNTQSSLSEYYESIKGKFINQLSYDVYGRSIHNEEKGSDNFGYSQTF